MWKICLVITNSGNRFSDNKNLLLFVSNKVKYYQFQELVEKIVYPLHEEYGNAYQAFQKSSYQPVIFGKLDIPIHIRNALLEQNQRIYEQSEVKIHALFEAEVF